MNIALCVVGAVIFWVGISTIIIPKEKSKEWIKIEVLYDGEKFYIYKDGKLFYSDGAKKFSTSFWAYGFENKDIEWKTVPNHKT